LVLPQRTVKRIDACYNLLSGKHTRPPPCRFYLAWPHLWDKAQCYILEILHQSPQSETPPTRNPAPKSFSETSPLQKPTSLVRWIVVNYPYTHCISPSRSLILHSRIWSANNRLRPPQKCLRLAQPPNDWCWSICSQHEKMGLCGSDLCECGKVETALHILHDRTKFKPLCHIYEVDPALLEYLVKNQNSEYEIRSILNVSLLCKLRLAFTVLVYHG